MIHLRAASFATPYLLETTNIALHPRLFAVITKAR